MKKNISVALVISTYNSPAYLSLCLRSVAAQTVLPDEIVIADDGSGDETARVVTGFKREMEGLAEVKHIWHPDEGFRKTIILNKAIAAASGEYIIQVDGDVILHPDFIKDHCRAAQEGAYIAGSRVNVRPARTRQVVDTGDMTLNVFQRGVSNFLNGLRIPLLQRVFASYHSKDIYHARGCNLAHWRSDFLRINGYNERITGWGLEDTELIVRLRNAGISPRTLKFGGIMFHLYHKEASRDRVTKNDMLLKEVVDNRTVRCTEGVDKYLSGVPGN